jgi:hypothetical protein
MDKENNSRATGLIGGARQICVWVGAGKELES